MTGPHSDATTFPRFSVTRNDLPSSACAAVLPSATINSGCHQPDLFRARAGRRAPRPPTGFLCSRRRVSSRSYELEMLDRIGDVDRFPRNPRRFQRRIQEPAGRTDEGTPGLVLLVTGLLAHEHGFRSTGPSPNTVWVACRQRPQPRHRGGRASLAVVGRGGMKSAADPVEVRLTAGRAFPAAARSPIRRFRPNRISGRHVLGDRYGGSWLSGSS